MSSAESENVGQEKSMIYDDGGLLSPLQQQFLVELEASLSRKLASKIISREFVALEAASDKTLVEDIARGRFRVALAAKGRNRYSDVLPYDDNRVRLRCAVPDVKAMADDSSSSTSSSTTTGGTAGRRDIGPATSSDAACYINASPLESPDQDVAWHLIAAQAPLRATRAHFWQAVLESGSRNVVQLANYSEAGVVKAHPYHAADLGWKKVYAGISVKTLASKTHGALIKTTLDVRDRALPSVECRSELEGNDGRVDAGTDFVALTSSPSSSYNNRHHVRVRHWLYTGWPDHGVPLAADCGALLDLVDAMVPEIARPIVVHCSAGIGRTGVFAVLLISARRVEAALQECDHEEEVNNNESTLLSPSLQQLIARIVDLRSLVAALRAQRAGCVQTAEQYRFAYSALLELIKRRRGGSRRGIQ